MGKKLIILGIIAIIGFIIGYAITVAFSRGV